MNKINRPRGTQDFLPDKAELLNFINVSAAHFFESYGYRRIITPTFESEDLFKRSVGESTDIVQKEMYDFTDKGGRKMALRPEGTAPIVRAYIENNLQALVKPVKLYYMGQMFRYERPQAGRYREFWQMGAEAIGADDPAIDAEVIELCYSFLKSLAIKNMVLKVNSMGCKECRPNYIKELRKFLDTKKGQFCKTCAKRMDINPLRVFDCKQQSCIKALHDSPKIIDFICDEDRAHFDKICSYLDSVGVVYETDPHLVRGFDYYTKTTFEILSASLGSQNALAGGGRYDYLISDYGGKEEPAIGFAFGTERIMLAFETQKIMVFTKPEIDVYVVWVEDAQKDLAFKTMTYLRDKHINANMTFGDKKMSAQMKLANKAGAKAALIIGEEEAKTKEFTYKNLETSSQEKLKLQEIIEKIRSK